METEELNSPTPWYLDFLDGTILSKDHDAVCTPYGQTVEEANANAELIVKAVNTYRGHVHIPSCWLYYLLSTLVVGGMAWFLFKTLIER
jgi:hypothetical protein